VAQLVRKQRPGSALHGIILKDEIEASVIVTAKRPQPRAPKQPQPEAEPLRIVGARKPKWRPVGNKPAPQSEE